MNEQRDIKVSKEEILQYVLDTEDQPFSIHQITTEGKKTMEKEPGDWYGVNSIGQVIDAIYKKYQPDGSNLNSNN